ncbi:MAG: hypothetical protein WD187_02870 [Candidatus Woykebacteria bacterium]
MEQKLEEIKKRFGGKLIGNKKMQRLVAETLLKLPPDVIDFVTENVWFVSSFEDSWGFVLDSKDLGNKHVIFFGDELFEQDNYAQAYTVAHEIGHVVLGHRNAFLAPQSRQETEKQEAEAHKFVLRCIKK